MKNRTFPPANGPAVVIGYGNSLRGDDGVGPRVAEALARRGLPGVRALPVPQLAPELAEALALSPLAVFVDARIGLESERVEIVPLGPADGPEALGHVSDPRALLALARAVYGRCPRAWGVFVPAVSFEFGAGLSPTAERGAFAAVQEIVHLLEQSAAVGERTSHVKH